MHYTFGAPVGSIETRLLDLEYSVLVEKDLYGNLSRIKEIRQELQQRGVSDNLFSVTDEELADRKSRNFGYWYHEVAREICVRHIFAATAKEDELRERVVALEAGALSDRETITELVSRMAALEAWVSSVAASPPGLVASVE